MMNFREKAHVSKHTLRLLRRASCWLSEKGKKVLARAIMSQKGKKRVKRPFISPPVESLSALDFLWQNELLKEIEEYEINKKKRKASDELLAEAFCARALLG